MMKVILSAVSMTLLLSANADGTAPDPETWFRDAYGELWADRPADKIEQILGFYADTVETHSSDGEVSRSAKMAWLSEPMKEWLAAGWLNSELTGVKVDRINATTAVFKSSWLDRYTDAPEEISCGWYLADLRQGAWQFSAYADIDCAAHGL